MQDPSHYSLNTFFRPNGPAVVVVDSHHQKSHVLHTHDFCELVLVVGGEGEHITKNRSYHIQRGDVFVVDEDGAHGYSLWSDLDIVNILFLPQQLQPALRDLHDLPGLHALLTLERATRQADSAAGELRLTSSQLQRAMDWVREIQQEQQAEEPGYGFVITALFMRLLAFLARQYSQGTSPRSQKLYRLGEVVSHMQKHLDQEILVDDLARIAHLSPRQFHRSFKASTGDSPLQYLLHLRIERAKELLRNNSDSITDIAYQVGFHDSNYFTRIFGQKTGHSPRQFRSR